MFEAVRDVFWGGAILDPHLATIYALFVFLALTISVALEWWFAR